MPAKLGRPHTVDKPALSGPPSRRTLLALVLVVLVAHAVALLSVSGSLDLRLPADDAVRAGPMQTRWVPPPASTAPTPPVQKIAAPRTLYEEPKNTFVANFIGENNRLNGRLHSHTGERCVVELARGEKVEALAVNVGQIGGPEFLGFGQEVGNLAVPDQGQEPTGVVAGHRRSRSSSTGPAPARRTSRRSIRVAVAPRTFKWAMKSPTPIGAISPSMESSCIPPPAKLLIMSMAAPTFNIKCCAPSTIPTRD
ncbi:hypothetical protein [uncultured Limnohabitans sp.]|uniref:hypothetical protein n=1 Tax=uncultured Limnohabitans sp. TaxID=768543 RepID=UPI00262C4F37|nr:hypothetical protein [uncultured Limnohabitans sp.]